MGGLLTKQTHLARYFLSSKKKEGETIKELVAAFEALGHSVTVTAEGKISPKHNGAASSESKALVAEMRQYKADVLEYLIRRDFIKNAPRELETTGYVRFWSQHLMDIVYIIKDWDILTSLPNGAIVFSLQEIRTLAAGVYTPADLHEIATEKRAILAKHRAYMENQTKAPPALDGESRQATSEDAINIFDGTIINS